MNRKAKRTRQHGGAREGAGRPVANPEGRTVVIGASVPEKIVKRMDAWIRRNKSNRSALITDLLRQFLKGQK